MNRLLYVRSISVRSTSVYNPGVFVLSLRYMALGYIFELDADVDLGSLRAFPTLSMKGTQSFTGRCCHQGNLACHLLPHIGREARLREQQGE